MGIDFLEQLIDRIYEAALLPELWPGVLGQLTIVGGGGGALLFTHSRGEMRWTASPDLAPLMVEYVAQGWPARTDRAHRLDAARHPGFLGDLDVYSREEMDREAVFTQFLRPRGFGWGVATAIPVPTGDSLHFDVERRYEAGPVDAETIQRLDLLRPHLARAALISARLRLERVRAAAEALALVGLPAAVLNRSGRPIMSNKLIEPMVPATLREFAGRLAFAHKPSDVVLADALARLAPEGDIGSVRSIPVPAHEGQPPMIVHLVPVRGAAHDVFSGAYAILVVTPVVPRNVPTADVLQGLFDLSPAEARVARAIGERRTVEAIAEGFGLSRETVRTQLKAVLAKTGLGRQGDLAALLAGSDLPGTSR